MLGQTLNQRYSITARIGNGAMGTVYRGIDAQTGQDVAIKVLNRELTLDHEILERFRREGDALRQLRHPNIVGLVDTFVCEGQHLIVMEYVPGGNLHQLIRQGSLPIDRARRIALGLCDALTRAHELNIVHRDIKPENILLAGDGTAKLTDFGVARLISEGTRLTGTGTQVGTPYYMAPEAWEGTPLDAQADIWALGVVLFEMLTGQVPFGGDTLVAVMNKVLTAPLPDMRQQRADVPPGLARIVAGMLTRDKARRYASIRRVAADLEQGESTMVAPPAAPARKPPAWRRWLVWGAIAGILVVAAVGVLIAGVLQLAPGLVPGRPAPTASPSATFVPGATLALAETVPPATATNPPPQASPAPPPTTLVWGQSLISWGGDIWVSDSTGKYAPLGLADKFVNIDALTWAPDGQRLAFTACLPGEVTSDKDTKQCNVLYVARRDGTEVTKVAPLTGVLGMAWSPNGEWLAYGDGNLKLIRPDGSDQRELVVSPGGWATWQAPAWSPDSQWLAYRVNKCSSSGCENAHRIDVVSAAGGQAQTVFDLATAQLGWGNSMAWSPDGGRLVAATDSGDGYQISIDCAKAPGGCTQLPSWAKLRHMPENWLTNFYPQWAPDRIASAVPTEQARAFAEPILAAIASLPPDYADDFSQPDSGWAAANVSPGNGYGYQDGTYVISNQGVACQGSSSRAMPMTTDFVLTVDFRFLSGVGSALVVYRASPDGRAQCGTGVTTDGAVNFHKNVDGVHIPILSPVPIPASAFKPGDAINRLTIVARGAYVAALVNGEPIDMIEDHSSGKGDISLGSCVSGDSSQPLQVAYDNFKLWDLTRVSGLP